LDIFSQFEKEHNKKVILVGHSVVSDIEALKLDQSNFIDTTNFKFKADQQGRVRSLKDLAEEHLGLKVQESVHSSLEDARTTLSLYLKFKDHPEGFYSDKTKQVYSRDQRVVEQEQKIKTLQKKRVKKVHRKDFINKMERNDPQAEAVQGACQTVVSTSAQAARLIAYGIGVYSI